MELTLRDYQINTLHALNEQWQQGVTRVAVVLPTGMGKTVIFSKLAQHAHANGQRPLVLVHRDELANQAADKLHSVMPNTRIGKVKAEHNDVDTDVIVGSVQTLARTKRLDQLSNIGTIIVDEAHHAAAASYLKILHQLGSFNGLPTSGWTATLARGDDKKLGDVWETAIDDIDILWGIDHGYLVDVKGKRVTVDGLDLAEVARTRGDFQEGSLGNKLLSVGAGEHIAKAYIEHAADRQGVLFAPTVASAAAFAQDLTNAGIMTECVFGITDLDTRRDIYERFRTGTTQVLSNAMVLTEGWDAPWVSCAVIARPTSHASLYVQMVGRILRPWPNKHNALVLDVVGVSAKHKLASLADLSKGNVRVEEGETLQQARERKEIEAGRRGAASGVVASEDVDLFDRSRSSWLQTRAGTWFIPTREQLVFLWPQQNGLFKVGKCSNRSTKDGQWIAEDMTLDYGMAWAEQTAQQLDPSIARRDAPWRKRNLAPTQQQSDLAWRLGIKVEWGATRAQVSDQLSTFFASKLLDRR